jgi:Phosphate acetyl/butaryl transferase
LIARAKAIPAIPTAVVWPCEAHALAGPVDAGREKIIAPVLVGLELRIRSVAAEAGLDLGGCEILDAASEEEAAAAAVRLVRAGQAHSLMKGSLHTDVMMHAVVTKEGGLRTARRISHVFLIDVPTYPDVLFVTDAAINIFPDLEAKRDIVQNAIDLHIGLGLGDGPLQEPQLRRDGLQRLPANREVDRGSRQVRTDDRRAAGDSAWRRCRGAPGRRDGRGCPASSAGHQLSRRLPLPPGRTANCASPRRISKDRQYAGQRGATAAHGCCSRNRAPGKM